MKIKALSTKFYRENSKVIIFGLIIIFASYIFSVLFSAVTGNGIGFAEAWNRWDAPHYLSIAQNGYLNYGDEANFIVFYPLFPFATYIISIIFKNIFLSSLIVSNIFYLLSIVYFYKLVRLDYDEKISFRAVVLISIFPTAYFFHAPYTESIFLFVSLVSVYLARKDNWLGASLMAIFACLGRVTGLVLPAILLIEFFCGRAKKKDYFNLLYLLLIAIGPLIYFYINYSLFKDPLHFLIVQKEHWGHYNFYSPIKNLIDTYKSTSWLSPDNWFILVYMQIIFTVFAFISTIASFFMLRLSYAIYSLLSLLLITTPSFWMSNPRYVLVIFPVFIVLALISRTKFVYFTLIGLFLVLFFILFSVYLSGPFAF